MSVYLYDVAIVEKFRKWIRDEKVSISAPETLFSYRADNETGDFKLGFISLFRTGYSILTTGKTPLSREGFKLIANEDMTENLRAIPISIAYQIDIYTRSREENDNLCRELIFKLVNNPKLKISIPYKGVNKEHTFHLQLEDQVIDNSDIADHLEKGEKFRTTMNLEAINAYLFSYAHKDTLEIEIDVEKE